jgi:catechol 2,3-dioxygenase-like lactoylglutathione lyase family enzyme
MKLWLHHVNVCSTDVPGLAEFYRSVLDLGSIPALQTTRRTEGYAGDVAFMSDGTTQFHLAERDLGVAFRTGQPINPLDRGHIAFRTDDIEAFKDRLREKGIPFADYGGWAMNGWHQIFFQDPEGTVIEVHQAPPGTP